MKTEYEGFVDCHSREILITPVK